MKTWDFIALNAATLALVRPGENLLDVVARISDVIEAKCGYKPNIHETTSTGRIVIGYVEKDVDDEIKGLIHPLKRFACITPWEVCVKHLEERRAAIESEDTYRKHVMENSRL